MDFTYWLPDENGNKTENKAASNSVIIIGANGSGKSKLGAWIEQQNMSNIHRLALNEILISKKTFRLKVILRPRILCFLAQTMQVESTIEIKDIDGDGEILLRNF